MRDIRSDLQERANLIEQEITQVLASFEKRLEPLRRERDAHVAELKAELAAFGVLIEAEHQRVPNDPRSMESERQHTPTGPRSMAPSHQSLSDFLARKLAETGPRSTDDLSSFAVQAGYFPDTERASPGVRATLGQLLRGDRISQLPDGRLAPARLSQMIQHRQPA
jgi:hypothetical protein